ncbi:stalk domain-containing protein [Paenibacillus campi]|uniref:stalk domain-containing protein n=1 Tax=Paenibacillus campi TaxID=3106031 RepID=UPI002AFE9BA7|nr:stalk domain-containing protein [Paenibacillus sp. SGZ-1014]
MNKWMRITATGMLTAVITATTAYTGTGFASAAELLELKIKKGSTAATINGDKQTIIKPYEAGGTTMVQLGLFSRAFGAKVELHENDIIQLISGKHTIMMTISSKSATVNGKKIVLPAAPVMHGGTLMVPLRPLVQAIGGKMQVVSGQIVVTLSAAEAQTNSKDTASEHADKTRVGSSKYKWSIKYPEDLVYLGGSDASVANFMDTGSTYLLQVAVKPDTVTSSVYSQPAPDDLLNELVNYIQSLSETVLDQQTVNGANGTYARVISRTQEGYLSETRLYAGNGNLYYVMYADSKAYSYKDFDDNQELLNSFQMSFNANDNKSEDLSAGSKGEADGQPFENADYGISVTLPSDWTISDDGNEASNKDNSYAKFGAYGTPTGQSLQDWAKHIQTWFGESFAADHYRYVSTTERQIDGHPAIVNEMQYRYNDDQWYTEYEVLLQKDGYRYYFEYSGHADDPLVQSQFESIVNSMKVDFDTLESNFGHLPVDYYSVDRTKLVTRTSPTYNYSLQVPRYWTDMGNDYTSANVAFYYTGGNLSLTIKNTSSLEKAVADWKTSIQSASSSSKPILSEGQAGTFAGVPSYTFTVTYPSSDTPYTGTYTLFTKGKRTFIVASEINDANNSSTHQAEIAKVLSSFTWTGN